MTILNTKYLHVYVSIQNSFKTENYSLLCRIFYRNILCIIVIYFILESLDQSEWVLYMYVHEKEVIYFSPGDRLSVYYSMLIWDLFIYEHCGYNQICDFWEDIVTLFYWILLNNFYHSRVSDQHKININFFEDHLGVLIATKFVGFILIQCIF